MSQAKHVTKQTGCIHPNSGGAAPVRSGTVGILGTRHDAQARRHRAASSGAAQEHACSMPIWMAALSATTRLARQNGSDQAVSWDCISGRALYTNAGSDTETIEPLGVSLKSGQTLAVYWMPGETGYTMEVYAGN